MVGLTPLPAARERTEVDLSQTGFTLKADPADLLEPTRRAKGVYIGAPACFALEMSCKIVCDAFAVGDGAGFTYIVGSCLERPDWRDVDVRLIMDDDAFQRLFPTASLISASWEHDARWTLLTVAISRWLSDQTGLPVDFQFQPMTWANERHPGKRNAVGITIRTHAPAKREDVSS